ncbi:uncharacterized protein RCC_04652 [Ramularia collo-cygni]|uniref:Uncharacterized protein n=1 Tax=Ramularia collo-cygni TaxID=112498 RepID=A0A2D3UUG1_9PEZI|nr:uncharacterized protein RCC_04652 [Ramularia collo-cygni]CZT18808.1 uncharacterized protein RCC_04652 [Ramularia collo-cygni]
MHVRKSMHRTCALGANLEQVCAHAESQLTNCALLALAILLCLDHVLLPTSADDPIRLGVSVESASSLDVEICLGIVRFYLA